MPPAATDVLLLAAAYLLGSLSGSLLLGRLRGVDIRTLGSGNAGGTNALRTQGWKFALGTIVVDVGKGALAVWLARRFGGAAWLPFAAGFAAMVGHVWPVFHGFRGGKGGGTLLGVLVVLWPLGLVVVLATWAVAFVLGGYVGLSTVLGVAALPVFGMLADAGPAAIAFAIASALFVAFTHRANLARLRAGSEPRVDAVRVLARLRRRSA